MNQNLFLIGEADPLASPDLAHPSVLMVCDGRESLLALLAPNDMQAQQDLESAVQDLDADLMAWASQALDIAAIESSQVLRMRKILGDDRLVLVLAVATFALHRSESHRSARRGDPGSGGHERLHNWIARTPDLGDALRALGNAFIDTGCIPCMPADTLPSIDSSLF